MDAAAVSSQAGGAGPREIGLVVMESSSLLDLAELVGEGWEFVRTETVAGRRVRFMRPPVESRGGDVAARNPD